MPRHIHGDGSILPGKRVAEYRVWANMHNRCASETSQQWEHYGGRGIRVCRRWSEYTHFLSDMGRRPSSQHSLERIDVNGNYEPSNCRWATAKEQARNRRSGRVLTHNGLSLSLSEWSERTGIPWSTLGNRLARGWSPAKTIETRPGSISCWDSRPRRAK